MIDDADGVAVALRLGAGLAAEHAGRDTACRRIAALADLAQLVARDVSPGLRLAVTDIDGAGDVVLLLACSRNGYVGCPSPHRNHTVDEVVESTGFDFERTQSVPETPAPSADTLALMRGPVARELAEVYPQFAAQVFGVKLPLSGRTASG